MSRSDVEPNGLFDRALSNENQEALDDLLTAIEANGNRLGIFIAACDDRRLQAEIVEQYEQALTAEGFRHYRLTLPKEEPSLKRLVAEQVKADEYLRRGGLAVISVRGAQRLSSLRGEEARGGVLWLFAVDAGGAEGVSVCNCAVGDASDDGEAEPESA